MRAGMGCGIVRFTLGLSELTCNSQASQANRSF